MEAFSARLCFSTPKLGGFQLARDNVGIRKESCVSIMTRFARNYLCEGGNSSRVGIKPCFQSSSSALRGVFCLENMCREAEEPHCENEAQNSEQRDEYVQDLMKSERAAHMRTPLIA